MDLFEASLALRRGFVTNANEWHRVLRSDRRLRVQNGVILVDLFEASLARKLSRSLLLAVHGNLRALSGFFVNNPSEIPPTAQLSLTFRFDSAYDCNSLHIDRATITAHNHSQFGHTYSFSVAPNLIAVPAFYLGIRRHLEPEFSHFQRRYLP